MTIEKGIKEGLSKVFNRKKEKVARVNNSYFDKKTDSILILIWTISIIYVMSLLFIGAITGRLLPLILILLIGLIFRRLYLKRLKKRYSYLVKLFNSLKDKFNKYNLFELKSEELSDVESVQKTIFFQPEMEIMLVEKDNDNVAKITDCKENEWVVTRTGVIIPRINDGRISFEEEVAQEYLDKIIEKLGSEVISKEKEIDLLERDGKVIYTK